MSGTAARLAGTSFAYTVAVLAEPTAGTFLVHVLSNAPMLLRPQSQPTLVAAVQDMLPRGTTHKDVPRSHAVIQTSPSSGAGPQKKGAGSAPSSCRTAGTECPDAAIVRGSGDHPHPVRPTGPRLTATHIIVLPARHQVTQRWRSRRSERTFPTTLPPPGSRRSTDAGHSRRAGPMD